MFISVIRLVTTSLLQASDIVCRGKILLSNILLLMRADRTDKLYADRTQRQEFFCRPNPMDEYDFRDIIQPTKPDSVMAD